VSVAKIIVQLGSIAVPLCALAIILGCRDPSAGESRRKPATSADARSGLFESVAENLDHLEQFDTEQINKLVCDRLNQWYLQEKPQSKWEPDPLVHELSDPLRRQPGVESLELVRFQNPDDAWFLQEAVWLRDISRTARADRFQDLAVAERLFDWTIRNIQLEPDAEASRRRPYETLLFGRGTALERAWVFMLLARQQGLDVVLLGLADESGGAVRPWLPALVLGDDLYLFDCRLGLPIPGTSPGSVATLAQVAADEQLLRGLDLDEDHPYPVRAEDVQQVVALVEGSPASLSRRMALVEARLAGKHRMKLTSPGSELAERVAKLPHVAQAKLWTVPFEVELWKSSLTPEQRQTAAREMLLYQAMPALRRGRALHFKGQYDGEQGAKTLYLNARPPDQFIENYKLSDELIEQMKIPRASVSRVEAAQTLLMREGKQNASFWLGLIFFEQDDHANAVDYFANRTLEARDDSPWAAAARYNLARTYEAEGDLAKAIELYDADADSPQSHGNRLRARRLKDQLETAVKEPAAS
jgi:hypothetical protein